MDVGRRKWVAENSVIAREISPLVTTMRCFSGTVFGPRACQKTKIAPPVIAKWTSGSRTPLPIILRKRERNAIGSGRVR